MRAYIDHNFYSQLNFKTMKKLLSLSNLLKTVVSVIAMSLFGCQVENLETSSESSIRHNSSELVLYSPSSSISITTEATSNFEYSIDEIEEIFYDLFPAYEQYANDITIDKIYSENYLPYMESLYLATCTADEVADWFAHTYEVPSVWMYLLNLPNSGGYALLNADKRVGSPLVIFQKGDSLNPHIFDDFSEITLPLSYYVANSSNQSWLYLDSLYRDFAYRTFGWPYPYYTIDFITSWYDDLTTMHEDPNAGGGGITYPCIYSKTNYKPNYCSSNGIYKWTDYFPYGEYEYLRTGTIPLSIIKAMAYKQYYGNIGHIQNVDLSTYYYLANPSEPYIVIFEMGSAELNSQYYPNYTTTDKYDALSYLNHNYMTTINQVSLLNNFVNHAFANEDVVIYEMKDLAHGEYEWNLINGIETITKSVNSGAWIKITDYYEIDNHSGGTSIRRLYNGTAITVH